MKKNMNGLLATGNCQLSNYVQPIFNQKANSKCISWDIFNYILEDKQFIIKLILKLH